MRSGVTVVIPTIPPRALLLGQAIRSAVEQTVPADGLSVSLDAEHAGAAATRQRALQAVQTPWTAFLDDDDWWYPHHLATLLRLVNDHGADYAYSWFDGNNPFPAHRGKQMDPTAPHHTTMNVLVKTELAKEVGFTNHPDQNDRWPGEDWNFTLGCVTRGARFIGTGEVTWHYNVHSSNTSGLGSRW